MGVSAASRLQRRDCSVVMGVTAASWLQCRALDLDVCVGVWGRGRVSRGGQRCGWRWVGRHADAMADAGSWL